MMCILYPCVGVFHIDKIREGEETRCCSNNENQPVCPHLHRAGHGAEGEDRGTVLDGGLAVEGPLGVHQEHSHLAAVGLVHHKHFAPDLDPGGLPLAAAPPGEARQGLVVSPHPVLALLRNRVNDQV